ncbi:hypothetical protein OOK29_33055 [Streptomyces phaeochromogenes]|uniref:hypothetical protein n=1 Tax=Streptomyces phaeochromogenes TaxID=1923 RepID=UPI00225B716D|nr:hypothetical protein [Streptomyces phaeochromogenes]MCX5602974.1 hypothetical protein [Streptomyces phaeochromogenes]
MQQFFFAESKAFGSRVEQLFNFIHPASVALWNLRWQVQGFVSASPGATEAELSGRFSSGSGIKASNLKEVCVETPWESQMGQFAQIVGANMIALYEGWSEEIFFKLTGKRPGRGPGPSKDIQFPSRGQFGRVTKGVRDVLADMHAIGISSEMKAAFFPVYSASKKYSHNELDGLTALYRYHKEIRNSFMHGGGLASKVAETAWRNASTLTKVDIGGKADPILTQITEGQSITYTIEEAIQLADVIIRLVHTIDAELSYSSQAEQYFLDAWKASSGILKLQQLPTDTVRRDRRIAKICRKVGFVTPADPAAAITLGKRAGMIS